MSDKQQVQQSYNSGKPRSGHSSGRINATNPKTGGGGMGKGQPSMMQLGSKVHLPYHIMRKF